MGRMLYLLAFLTALSSCLYAQQNIQFTQYIFNGLAVNPAYAGYKEQWTANLSYRLQWQGFEGAPKTASVSLDGIIGPFKKSAGIGFQATNDRLGPQSTSSFFANYAYRLRLDELDTRRLSFGIALGATQYTLDASLFKTTDPSDPLTRIGNDTELLPDLRLGIYYSSPNLYAGASMLNVLESKLSKSNTALTSPLRHLYVTAGMMIPLSENVDLKPSFLVKEDFNGPTNIDLTGFLLIHKLLWTGATYRTSTIWKKKTLQSGLEKRDALAAIIQLNVNTRLRIGYSYDYSISKLAGYENGSHELNLSLGLPVKKGRIISPRYF